MPCSHRRGHRLPQKTLACQSLMNLVEIKTDLLVQRSRPPAFRSLRALRGSRRKSKDANCDEREKHERSAVTAQCQSPMVNGFVKEVADNRAQWTSQNEGRPEQANTRNSR